MMVGVLRNNIILGNPSLYLREHPDTICWLRPWLCVQNVVPNPPPIQPGSPESLAIRRALRNRPIHFRLRESLGLHLQTVDHVDLNEIPQDDAEDLPLANFTYHSTIKSLPAANSPKSEKSVCVAYVAHFTSANFTYHSDQSKDKEMMMKSNLLLKSKDVRDTAIDGIFKSRLSFITNGDHRLMPSLYRKMKQEFRDITSSKHFMHGGEMGCTLIGIEIWCKYTPCNTFPPQELASSARPTTTTSTTATADFDPPIAFSFESYVIPTKDDSILIDRIFLRCSTFRELLAPLSKRWDKVPDLSLCNNIDEFIKEMVDPRWSSSEVLIKWKEKYNDLVFLLVKYYGHLD
ncbi:hypothetical protein LXL04_022729 [Taraxacum kok-saghyz]